MFYAGFSDTDEEEVNEDDEDERDSYDSEGENYDEFEEAGVTDDIVPSPRLVVIAENANAVVGVASEHR